MENTGPKIENMIRIMTYAPTLVINGATKPDVQGEERHLDGYSYQQEAKSDEHDPGMVKLRKDLGQVGHVERARDDVQITDAEQVEAGSDGPDDDVAKSRECGPFFAGRDQGVGCERCNFQEYIEIEHVARDDDPKQARDQQEEYTVERGLSSGKLPLDASLRVDRRHQRNRCQDERHEGAEVVDAILDPPGRLPPAQVVNQRTVDHDVVANTHG
jgi:hypothetical protein